MGPLAAAAPAGGELAIQPFCAFRAGPGRPLAPVVALQVGQQRAGTVEIAPIFNPDFRPALVERKFTRQAHQVFRYAKNS